MSRTVKYLRVTCDDLIIWVRSLFCVEKTVFFTFGYIFYICHKSRGRSRRDVLTLNI